jgi:hypothetical protein
LIEKQAYATDDPAILAAYRTAKAARHEFTKKLIPAVAAIGNNLGPLVAARKTCGGEEIVGLRPDKSGKIPAGWRLTDRGARLAPAITRAGDQARRWLAEHQPPAGTDPLAVLGQHGLPGLSRVGNVYAYKDYEPVVFEWDDKLWACYKGQPITEDGEPAEVTWPVVPVADCLVAMARAEGAATAHAN